MLNTGSSARGRNMLRIDQASQHDKSSRLLHGERRNAEDSQSSLFALKLQNFSKKLPSDSRNESNHQK